jgi:hypothetical protein
MSRFFEMINLVFKQNEAYELDLQNSFIQILRSDIAEFIKACSETLIKLNSEASRSIFNILNTFIKEQTQLVLATEEYSILSDNFLLHLFNMLALNTDY